MVAWHLCGAVECVVQTLFGAVELVDRRRCFVFDIIGLKTLSWHHSVQNTLVASPKLFQWPVKGDALNHSQSSNVVIQM